ncbi:MAG: esterase/lipase family protein [Methylococcales bacterium]
MPKFHQVSSATNLDYKGDAVFVHGLGGHYSKTWGADRIEDCWLAWLARDLPSLCIWTLEYDASPSGWLGMSMPLSDRAGNVAHRMKLQGIGKRPTALIGHSLGGLVIKQMLRHCSDIKTDPGLQKILSQIKAVAFLATPHAGSDLATWLDRLRVVLREAPAAKDLTANSGMLRDLNTWYKEHVGPLKIKTLCYTEGIKTGAVMVVEESSADPGITGVLPVKMDADHLTICKPESKTDDVYLGIKQFLEESILQESIVPNTLEPFKPVSPKQYRELLRTELVDRLKMPQLTGPAQKLCSILGVARIEAAVNELVPNNPSIQSVREWTRAVRQYLGEPAFDHRAKRTCWPFLQQVHLDLLKTLIAYEKIQEAIRDDDKLLLVLAVVNDSRNRPIEVLVARLDGNRNVEFIQDRSDRAAMLARPLYQLDAGDDGFSWASIPEPRIAVERLGQRLLACFDEDIPEQMEGRHWERLNAALGESRYGDRPYYFVIPDGHPVYSQPSVRNELRHYLPNLPRILIDAELGTTLFVCNPVELDEAIKAFYRMKPDQESRDEN